MVAVVKTFDEVLEEMEYKRLHPTWLDRFNQAVSYPLYRAWNDYNPVQLCREAKWALQRAKRGWADCDTWSLDWYLAGWLPDALRHLKKNKHGIPAAVFKTEDCDEDSNPSDEGMKAGEARWDAIMDQMIAGFEAYTRSKSGLYEAQLGPYPLHRPEGMSKEAWRLLKDARFQQSQELAKQDEITFQLGMALFTEHLSSLWD
jgi:hypothetical protein